MGISTHVLDISRGRPAAGVEVTLEVEHTAGQWRQVGEGRTNDDGRVPAMLPAGEVPGVGHYRLAFAVRPYFESLHAKTFYSEIVIAFAVENPSEQFHVPLLLSPFGYSTYRGS